jgi:uncharacterized protein (DUF1330 family)
MPVEPDADQIAALAEAGEGPVVMLNLNRYRDREAYAQYGVVALEVLQRVGGRILWQAEANLTVIGDDSDRYDEVIAVWYPSVDAFMELASDPKILDARKIRAGALERAALICCSETTPA